MIDTIKLLTSEIRKCQCEKDRLNNVEPISQGEVVFIESDIKDFGRRITQYKMAIEIILKYEKNESND